MKKNCVADFKGDGQKQAKKNQNFFRNKKLFYVERMQIDDES